MFFVRSVQREAILGLMMAASRVSQQNNGRETAGGRWMAMARVVVSADIHAITTEDDLDSVHLLAAAFVVV